MAYNISTSLVIPAAMVDAFDQLSVAMGHGAGNYSVPLSADGREPVTHFGSHAWTKPVFPMMVEAGKAGHYPEGLPADALAALLPHLRMVSSLPGDADLPGGVWRVSENTWETLLQNTGLHVLGTDLRTNINTATSAQLQAINNIGPATAQHIIDGRPWASVADLSQISGVSEAQAQAWEGVMTV